MRFQTCVSGRQKQMQLSWRPKPAPEFGRVSFLTEGDVVLPKHAVREELGRLVDATVQRLADRGIASSFAGSEWQAIVKIENEPNQRKFCELAGHLGRDPFDPEGTVATDLEGLDDLLPPTVLDDFCDAITPRQISPGASAIGNFLASVKSGAEADGKWRVLRQSLKVTNGLSPWQHGYRQAQELRERLGISGPVFEDIDSFLQRTVGSFELRTFEAPDGIDAIAAPSETLVPWFGIPSRLVRPQSRRFALCRALSTSWRSAPRL